MADIVRFPGDKRLLPEEKIILLQRAMMVCRGYINFAENRGAFRGMRDREGNIDDLKNVYEMIDMMMKY